MSKDSSKQQPRPQLLSDLPYARLKRLSDRLDLPCDGKQLYWRKLIEAMPDSPYDQLTVERFAMNANRVDGSPAYALLTDMSNRGVTYDQLIVLLKKLGHKVALQELGYKEEVRFTKQPQAKPVVERQQLILECSATGVPAPDFLWFKERTPLPQQTTPTLVIEKVTKDDEGSYCCRATNDLNAVFSSWAEVKVQKPPILQNQALPGSDALERPEILQQPPRHVEVPSGHELQLGLDAEGPGSLSYQWFHNGVPLQFATGPQLRFPHATAGQQGEYLCRVSSSCGDSVLSESSHVQVLIPAQPQQFTGQTVPPMAAQPVPPMPAQPVPPMPAQPVSSHTTFAPQYDIGRPSVHESEYYVEAYQGVGPPLHAGIDHTHPHTQPFSESNYTGVSGSGGYSRIQPQRGPGYGYITAHRLSPDEEPVGQDQADMSKPCYDKVALLIGNKDYRVGKLVLNTPEIDTQDLGGILRSADFKVVQLVNLSKDEMEQAVNYFMSLLGKNVYALFFFAGHGFELASMNYMMPVDAAMDKNPEQCLCAQAVLDRMQSCGAKLSIVLLDMCRVRASRHAYSPEAYDSHPKNHNGYFVYGFSCSPSERAYEVDTKTPNVSIPPSEKENSIFVSALKKSNLRKRIDILLTDAAAGVRHRGNSCSPASWQKPEIRHNMGEPLSLWDPITHSHEADSQREQRARLWQSAHMVPEAIVVSSPRAELVLRLHFEAEHSNVLVVTAELLNGCLAHTEVDDLKLELIPDNYPHMPHLTCSVEHPNADSQFAYGHDKKQKKKDLIHFRIPDIQKLQSLTVTLKLEATYHFNCEGKAVGKGRVTVEPITTSLSSPLYAKVVANSAMFQEAFIYPQHS